MPIVSLFTDENMEQGLAQKVAESIRKSFMSANFKDDVEVRRFKTDVLLNANKLHADVRFRKDDFWTDEKISQVQQVFMHAIGQVLDKTGYSGKYSCLVVAEPLGSAWSQEAAKRH